MNILIDIGHPAHVHYFRNLYPLLVKEHKIVVACKSESIIMQLLDAYQIPYIELGKKGVGLIGKIVKQVWFNWQIFKLIKVHNIDLAIGVSLSVIYASMFSQAKSILFIDDDKSVVKLIAKYAAPFADTILSPDVLKHEASKNCVYYPGYHELAYLHPSIYWPAKDVLKKYGIKDDEKYFILRFTAQRAHHDVNVSGLSVIHKRKLIDVLERYGRVFITMECNVNGDFEQYRIPILPQEMHDFLYYSQMLVSDSQTMSSEASMLGVPSFRCNTLVGEISYLEEEEKRYRLTFGYHPEHFEQMLQDIEDHLQMANLKEIWKTRRDRMLKDKIHVTEFWYWFLINYPKSFKMYKENRIDYNEFS